MSDVVAMRNGATEQAARNGLDGRLELLEKSYARLSDVNKEIEDRVGRLLGGVSFLTAAVLALAALNSSQYATRRYFLSPYHVPLALATVVVFLVSVTFAVILLIAAMAGPLGLPLIAGEGAKARYSNKGRPKSHRDYVQDSSQLDYKDIADLTRDEWKDKWGLAVQRRSLESIKASREQSLAGDIHNMAVNIAFKHDRNAEAVTMLIYALLAFAGSVFVVTLAAYKSAPAPISSIVPVHVSSPTLAASGNDVTLRGWARFALAVIFATYFWLTLALPDRLEQQSPVRCDDNEGFFKRLFGMDDPGKDEVYKPPSRKLVAKRNAFSVAVFALVVMMLMYNADWPSWARFLVIQLELAFTLVCIAAFAAIVHLDSSGREDERNIFATRLTVAVLALAMLVGGVVSELKGWYFGQFVAVWGGSLLLLAVAMLRPTFALSRRRNDARRRA